LPSGEVYSHEGKRLERHLLQTARLAGKIACQFELALSEQDVAGLLLHDLAKAHPLFQRHLLEHKGKFGHAEPSAVFVLAVTRDILCAEAVRRHHGHLENLEDVRRFWSCWEYDDNVSRILKKIPVWRGAEMVQQQLGISVQNWCDLLPGCQNWDDLIFDRVELYPPDDLPKPDIWLKLRLLYSLLATADRYDAAVDAEIDYQPLTIDPGCVDTYASSLRDRPLADWRQQVRTEVAHHVLHVLDKPGIYTLTLPTGAGKTLIGLETAIRSAGKLGATGIIYTLPYVSLVEQNAAVAKQLLAETMPVREDHYLSDITRDHDDGSEITPRERFLEFFRYWQEPAVITTMAKLWEVLYSPKANDSMSLHRLSRAIVLLDEPQTIPAKFWDGLGKTMQLLVDRLQTTFILMTATQPEIARGVELTPRSYSFPRVRHRFEWHAKKRTLPEQVEELMQRGLAVKSSLMVVNTKKEALLAYHELMSRDIRPYFLSGWVTPVDRREILSLLAQDEKDDRQRWLVATQVIEAGIDLDFPLVFRDLGPFDSIIQVAGRCNRHGKHDLGEVLITELMDDRGKSYAGYVYDSQLLVATRLILRPAFDECDCPELVRAYYRKVREITAADELWDDICAGRWGEHHDLIKDEERGSALLVVDYAEAGADLEILDAKSDPADRFKLVEQKRMAFKRMGQHSVSVPAKALEEWSLRTGGMIFDSGGDDSLREASPGLWLVKGDGLGKIYSHQIGFIPPELADLQGCDDDDR
jgi:CRISPR-associated endonuclease/helicase Cas3